MPGSSRARIAGRSGADASIAALPFDRHPYIDIPRSRLIRKAARFSSSRAILLRIFSSLSRAHPLPGSRPLARERPARGAARRQARDRRLPRGALMTATPPGPDVSMDFETALSVDAVEEAARKLAGDGPSREDLEALCAGEPAVDVRGLHAGYGRMEILHGIDLVAGRGQSLCLPCSLRVLRGGSWNNNPRNLRSANRNRNGTENRNNDNGIRVARTLPCRSRGGHGHCGRASERPGPAMTTSPQGWHRRGARYGRWATGASPSP